jgi:cystathionine beta-lyase/cystathionine gamma-synthase
MSRGRKERRAHIRSRLIHGKYPTSRWDFSHHLVPPITSTATFRLDTAARGARGFQQFAAPTSQKEELEPIYIYDRLDEPTRGMLEDNLAEAEGGETAVTFGSGMGAVAASLLVLLKSGDAVSPTSASTAAPTAS